MPTYAELRIAPPKSWDEFEEITCSAAKNRWKNPDFTRHGRQGQRQDGVDIYGVDDKGDLVGIQCKNTWGSIKLITIKDEVAKADSFESGLKRLYVATTSETDHALQKSVRELSDGRTAQGKFAVASLFWNDVWQDLTRDESRLYLEYIQQIGALPANAILASRVTTCTNRSYVRLQILSTLHTAESCFPWGDHVSILPVESNRVVTQHS